MLTSTLTEIHRRRVAPTMIRHLRFINSMVPRARTNQCGHAHSGHWNDKLDIDNPRAGLGFSMNHSHNSLILHCEVFDAKSGEDVARAAGPGVFVGVVEDADIGGLRHAWVCGSSGGTTVSSSVGS